MGNPEDDDDGDDTRFSKWKEHVANDFEIFVPLLLLMLLLLMMLETIHHLRQMSTPTMKMVLQWTFQTWQSQRVHRRCCHPVLVVDLVVLEPVTSKVPPRTKDQTWTNQSAEGPDHQVMMSNPMK